MEDGEPEFIIPATAGIIEGPKIRGRVKDFGADWLVIRHDNVCVVDVRLVLETDDGVLIHMCYDGILDLKEEQIAELLSGKYLQFKAPVYTTPRFETGHKNYLWLNKVKGAAIGEVNTVVDPAEVNYSVYALK